MWLTHYILGELARMDTRIIAGVIVGIGICLLVGAFIVVTHADQFGGIINVINIKGANGTEVTGNTADNNTITAPVSATPQPTPEMIYTTASPVPTQLPTPTPIVKSAKLLDGGMDNDTYSPGDPASVYVNIENTGTVVISNANLTIKAEKYFPNVGYVEVECPIVPLNNLNIQPNSTGRLEYVITIPVDYQGISTTGKYRFTVYVLVWGSNIGNFQKEITVK